MVADGLRPCCDQGVAFFKNDDGEYLPRRRATATVGMAASITTCTVSTTGKAIYERCQAVDDRRPLIYARSVWAGSQRYPASSSVTRRRPQACAPPYAPG